MQPHDPQPMAMQQHGRPTKVAPREPDPPRAPAPRLDRPATGGALRTEPLPRPERSREPV